MQKTQSSILIAIVLLMIFSINVGLACAGDYSVDWWRVQKRTYESGNSINRLAFVVKNLIDGSYPQTDVVQGISLLGPNGPVPLNPHTFMAYEILNGSLETSSGEWYYDSEFSNDNYWIADFSEDLAEGNYTLTVTDTDGEAMENNPATRYFGGVVELPQISSKSFRGFEDAGGNLLWQWDLPTDMATRSLPYDVDPRCMLDIFNGDDYIGMLWINVPSIVSGVYIPSNVMELARQKGDNFKLQLQIRDTDNTNRYYSNEINLSELKKERPVETKTLIFPIAVNSMRRQN